MRIAVISESPADQEAVHILAKSVLGPTCIAVRQDLQAAGWSGVLDILPVAIKMLHFRCEADGLIVVVDSDDNPISTASEENRLHKFRRVAEQTTSTLSPVSGHPPLRVAVGVAVPALEAWLLSADRQDFSEAVWENGLRTGVPPYSRNDLKTHLYGGGTSFSRFRDGKNDPGGDKNFFGFG
jgi:hypothetical protein